jgi:hypothetical protein
MTRELSDCAWWFDTAAPAPEETTEQLVTDAAHRAPACTPEDSQKANRARSRCERSVSNSSAAAVSGMDGLPGRARGLLAVGGAPVRDEVLHWVVVGEGAAAATAALCRDRVDEWTLCRRGRACRSRTTR